MPEVWLQEDSNRCFRVINIQVPGLRLYLVTKPASQGLVHTKAGDIHWTEIKKIMEDAVNYVISLLNEGVVNCNDIINKVQEKYGSYLSSREVLRSIINGGAKRYLEDIRYKDVNKYSALSVELNKCRELMSRGGG